MSKDELEARHNEVISTMGGENIPLENFADHLQKQVNKSYFLTCVNHSKVNRNYFHDRGFKVLLSHCCIVLSLMFMSSLQ